MTFTEHSTTTTTKAPLVPVRWIISILGMYSCALLFGQRAAMSVAIVSMTRGVRASPKISSYASSISSLSAVSAEANYHCAPPLSDVMNSSLLNILMHSPFSKAEEDQFQAGKPEFDWNEKLQGVVLGSSFYLYFIIPTVAGRITDSIGGKWVTFVGVLFPCLLTAAIPLTVRSSAGVGGLIAIQTLIGGFHGAIYPSLFSLFTRWFPADERAAANGGIIGGGSLGNSLMYLITGYLCNSSVGWPLVFYVLAALHLPWLLLWLHYVTNDPTDNRRVSDHELRYITTRVAVHKTAKRKVSVPWRSVLTSIPVWTSAITKSATAFGYFMLLAKMPSFLSTIFGVAIEQNGIFSAAATCSTGISSILAPPLAKAIIHRYPDRSILVRKVFQSVAMFGPAVALIGITLLECNLTAAITLMFIAMLCYGTLTGGEFTVISDFAPNFAGTVMGFAHILPNGCGILGPYMVGLILDADLGGADSNDKWNYIFYITAVFFAFGSVVFSIFATDKQQSWDAAANDEAEDGSSSNGGSIVPIQVDCEQPKQNKTDVKSFHLQNRFYKEENKEKDRN